MAGKTRALTARDIYEAKNEVIPLDGEWARAIGQPEYGEGWIVYGKEKNGKTTFALMLARYLSGVTDGVLYVSAEEQPTKNTFKAAMQRAGITVTDNIHFVPYKSFAELKVIQKKRRARRVVIVDNLSVYNKKVRPDGLLDLMNEFPRVTFIFLAHEDNDGEPLWALAKTCKLYASVIVNVRGLVASVFGRGGCPGGKLVIDDGKASLCYRENMEEENNVEL